jgi:hypothetical protein
MGCRFLPNVTLFRVKLTRMLSMCTLLQRVSSVTTLGVHHTRVILHAIVRRLELRFCARRKHLLLRPMGCTKRCKMPLLSLGLKLMNSLSDSSLKYLSSIASE